MPQTEAQLIGRSLSPHDVVHGHSTVQVEQGAAGVSNESLQHGGHKLLVAFGYGKQYCNVVEGWVGPRARVGTGAIHAGYGRAGERSTQPCTSSSS